MALFTEGKLFKKAGEGSGGGGGGDQHNLGWYATQSALEEAHPTAEAGDWAIVGSTDTVWIWDTDNETWVDTDTKGQVTSVNSKTGAVVLTPSDIGAATSAQGAKADTAVQPGEAVPQFKTMPTADESCNGDIIQFIGTTDSTYTKGYFYKCVSDGQDPATYSWTQTDVQPSPVIPDPLPSQTGNAGKFLTTDGTDASWSDKPLANTATGTRCLTILGTPSTTINAINIGDTSSANYGGVSIGFKARGDYAGVAVGSETSTTGNGIAIGASSQAKSGSGYSSIAIGVSAKANVVNAIQLGSGTNSDANTFKVGNANGNFEIMSADGTVPTARLTKVNTTITLTAAGWSSNTQTVNVTGMTATGMVLVSPDPTDQADYTSAGILCTAQAAGTLTFTCDTVPSGDIDVNVVML